jgi:hypothetical protein
MTCGTAASRVAAPGCSGGRANHPADIDRLPWAERRVGALSLLI